MKHLITLAKLTKPVMALATAAIIISGLTLSTSAHADKVRFLVAPGALSHPFSETYSTSFNLHGTPEGNFGFGFTLDFGFGQETGTLAIDYYVMGENEYEAIASANQVPTAVSATALFIGGRWHHDSGVYMGGGALGVELTSSLINPQGGNVELESDLTWQPAISWGYDWTADNGLLLGFNWMRSLSSDIMVFGAGTSSLAADAYVQQISFAIGYEW